MKEDKDLQIPYWGVDTARRQIILYNVHGDYEARRENFIKQADTQYRGMYE